MSRLAALYAEARRRVEGSQAFIPHEPHPKQREFLALECQEALYGGAAGGGKSDALLMAALQYVHVANYSALLLRRTYQDLALPGAIMDRASAWLSTTAAKWNGTDKRWTFPSGATLSFGYLDTERDKFRYASAEFQFIGFDELTQFPEGWYRFLFSRLRKPDTMPVPLRMRAATNPGGIGHEWVKRRFIDADNGPPFIPALLADNPSVDQAGYLASLAQLDATTRKQLLEGVWVRDSGGLVYQYDDARNGIDAAPACTETVLALDFGFTDATSFTILGWRAHDPTVYVLRSWKERGLAPGEAAEQIHALETTHRFTRIVGDIGGLGKGYVEEARRRFHVPIAAAEKNNKRGYIELMNGDLAAGRIKVVRGACEQLITEWLELPWSEDRAKESPGFDNHCADGALYGWRAAHAYVERPVEEPPKNEDARAAAEEAALVEQVEREHSAEWWER